MPIFELTDEKATEWTEARAAGKRSWVLTTATVWGSMMFVLMLVYWSVVDGVAATFTPKRLVIHALSWVIGGLIYAVVLWAIQERAYARHQAGPPEPGA